MANIITREDANKTAYLSGNIAAGEVTYDADGSPVMLIEGEEVPVMEFENVRSLFSLMVVQAGHGTKDPKFRKHAGEIFISGLEDFSEKRILLPVSVIRTGRQMFDAYTGAEDNKDPLCYSTNGVTPSNKVAMPMNPICCEIETRNGREFDKVVCPKAVWEDGKKPECNKYIDLAFLDITDGTPIPVHMTLKSTGLGAWNTFAQEYSRMKNVARLKKHSINDYVIVMTVEDKATYFVPNFRLEYSEEKPSRLAKLASFYRDNLFNRQYEDQEHETETVAPALSDDEKALAIDVQSSENGSEEGLALDI